MSDYERYGDYNDIEEDRPRGKSPVMLILKIITAVICISVVGILAFRMVLSSTYPDSVTNIYFNDKLAAYYESTGGDIGAKTQKLQFIYDDEKDGNFFVDSLIVIEGIDQLQITVRYNTGLLDKIAKENGLESLDPDKGGLFLYRLYDNDGNIYTNLTSAVSAAQFMYRYEKLVFDDVKTTPDSQGRYPNWIRLEISVIGAKENIVYSVPIYQNNENLSEFQDYILSDKEKPQ